MLIETPPGRNSELIERGYAFAYNALGSFWGFITGWLLALGSIFACAMYAMGFGYYFGTLLPFPLPQTALKGLGLIIIAVLTLLNCRGTKLSFLKRRRWVPSRPRSPCDRTVRWPSSGSRRRSRKSCRSDTQKDCCRTVGSSPSVGVRGDFGSGN